MQGLYKYYFIKRKLVIWWFPCMIHLWNLHCLKPIVNKLKKNHGVSRMSKFHITMNLHIIHNFPSSLFDYINHEKGRVVGSERKSSIPAWPLTFDLSFSCFRPVFVSTSILASKETLIQCVITHALPCFIVWTCHASLLTVITCSPFHFPTTYSSTTIYYKLYYHKIHALMQCSLKTLMGINSQLEKLPRHIKLYSMWDFCVAKQGHLKTEYLSMKTMFWLRCFVIIARLFVTNIR